MSVAKAIVRGFLANISIMYKNKKYIAGDMFAQIPNVTSKSKILTFNKGDVFRDEAGIRGNKGELPRGDLKEGDLNIDPIEFGFAKEVTDKNRRISKQQGAPPMNLDTQAIMYASDKRLLKRERIASALVRGTTWSGANEDAGGLWAAGDNNTFLVDVFTRIATIYGNTGIRPNSLMMDFKTWNSLQLEATLVERLKTTTDKIVSAALVAKILNLDNVFIGDSIYSSDGEKADGTDFTSVQIWEENAGKGMGFLYYKTPSPGLLEPNSLYWCRENYGDNNVSVEQTGLVQTRRWREESRSQEVYETAEQTDFVVSGADLGFLWTDTFAT